MFEAALRGDVVAGAAVDGEFAVGDGGAAADTADEEELGGDAGEFGVEVVPIIRDEAGAIGGGAGGLDHAADLVAAVLAGWGGEAGGAGGVGGGEGGEAFGGFGVSLEGVPIPEAVFVALGVGLFGGEVAVVGEFAFHAGDAALPLLGIGGAEFARVFFEVGAHLLFVGGGLDTFVFLFQTSESVFGGGAVLFKEGHGGLQDTSVRGGNPGVAVGAGDDEVAAVVDGPALVAGDFLGAGVELDGGAVAVGFLGDGLLFLGAGEAVEVVVDGLGFAAGVGDEDTVFERIAVVEGKVADVVLQRGAGEGEAGGESVGVGIGKAAAFLDEEADALIAGGGGLEEGGEFFEGGADGSEFGGGDDGGGAFGHAGLDGLGGPGSFAQPGVAAGFVGIHDEAFGIIGSEGGNLGGKRDGGESQKQSAHRARIN